MGPDLTAILKTLLSTAVIVGALAWVARSAINTWLARNLENYKRELATESARELERLRLTLRLEEAKQSRLHEKQARIIAELFARLERLHDALNVLASPVQHSSTNVNDLRSKAIERFDLFVGYYYPRAIWLDIETVEVINDIQTKLRKLLIHFNYNLDAQGNIADRKGWMDSYKQLQDEIPKARGLLDARFRHLLGVPERNETEKKAVVVSA